jgi:hypothetical protein
MPNANTGPSTLNSKYIIILTIHIGIIRDILYKYLLKRRLHVLCIVVLLGRAFCDLGALENFLA